MPEVGLTSGGVKLTGWSNVSIRKSLDAIADDFTFELTNGRAGTTREEVLTAADQLMLDDKAVIDIDGEVVLTGYVDDLMISHDARRTTMRVSGRSKTGDICDCSAEYNTGAWKAATLETVARDLCRPFGVFVIDAENLSSKAFERYRVEPGETVIEAIARGADRRQVLLVCNPKGNLEFIAAAEKPSGAVLELGVNVIEATSSRSMRDRFSVYKFKGQTFAEDNWNGVKASQLKGEAADPHVVRYRPFVINHGKAKSSEDLGMKAIWERNARAGKSLQYRCTVEEWTTQKAGKKQWLINQLVRVKDKWANIDADLLVTSVEFVLAESERVTRLELCDRAAYIPDPKAKFPEIIEPEPTPAAAVGKLFGVGAIGTRENTAPGANTVRRR